MVETQPLELQIVKRIFEKHGERFSLEGGVSVCTDWQPVERQVQRFRYWLKSTLITYGETGVDLIECLLLGEKGYVFG